jgi:hypothetical protein
MHKHRKSHNGPLIPLRYGSAKSEVCECGVWRMVDHRDRLRDVWVWRNDDIQEAAKDIEDL